MERRKSHSATNSLLENRSLSLAFPSTLYTLTIFTMSGNSSSAYFLSSAKKASTASCVLPEQIHDTRRVSLSFFSFDREKDEVAFVLNLVEAMCNHADPTKWKFTEREEKFIGYLDEAAKDVSHGHAKRTVV